MQRRWGGTLALALVLGLVVIACGRTICVPGDIGTLRLALGNASSGDVIQIQEGVHGGAGSCALLASFQGSIEISGPPGVHQSRRPTIACGQQRFINLVRGTLTLSDLNVTGSISLAETLAGAFGSCLLVSQGAKCTTRRVGMTGCSFGAIHSLGPGTVINLLDTHVADSEGAAVVVSGGASLTMTASSVVNTKTPTFDPEAVWNDMCGSGSISEAACLSAHPLPAGPTLCTEAGMDATGNFPKAWYGAKIRQCPGTTADVCRVYQALNLVIELGGVSQVQVPGGDFGGTCSGFCASFGLVCISMWRDKSNTCEVGNAGSVLNCDSADGTTSDHVCTCGRKSRITVDDGKGVQVHGGSTMEMESSHVSHSYGGNILVRGSTVTMRDSNVGAAYYGIVLQAQSTLNSQRSSFLDNNKAGVLVSEGSTASLVSVSSARNIGSGLEITGGSSASLKSSTMLSNRGHGVLVEDSTFEMSSLVKLDENYGSGLMASRSVVHGTSTRAARNLFGGFRVQSSTVSLSQCQAINNTVERDQNGGGYWIFDSNVILIDVEAVGNRAHEGGGLFWDGSSAGQLSVAGGLVSSNTAVRRGGGIRVHKLEPKVVTHVVLRERVLHSVTNETHQMALGATGVFYSTPKSLTDPAYGQYRVLSGDPTAKGYRDGIQNSNSPPRFAGADYSGYDINAAKDTIYFAELESRTIRTINVHSGDAVTIAGQTVEVEAGLDGIGKDARFLGPNWVSAHPKDGTLYISDIDPLRRAMGGGIRKMTLATGEVNLICSPKPGAKDGPLASAQFSYIGGMIFNAAGTMLYLFEEPAGDSMDPAMFPMFRLRSIDLITNTVTTIAGGGSIVGDGIATELQLGDMNALVLSPDEEYIFLGQGPQIMKLTLKTGWMTTIAGTPDRGSQDGGFSTARWSLISGFSFDVTPKMWELYFSDNYNSRLGKISFPYAYFKGTRISNNTAQTDDGAGISIVSKYTPVTFEAITIQDNTALTGSGGGMSVVDCYHVRVLSAQVSGNTARSRGGGLDVQFVRSLEISGSLFSANSAQAGAALHLTSLYLSDPLFLPPWIDPMYKPPDAVIVHGGSSLNVLSTFFTSNRVVYGGVMLAGNAKITVRDCVFDRNWGTMGAALALSEHSDVTVARTNFSSNVASDCGGALLLNSTKPLAVDVGLLLHGNEAGSGGGMCVMTGGGSGVPCSADMGEHLLMLRAASESPEVRIEYTSNLAEHGGGAAYITCLPNVQQGRIKMLAACASACQSLASCLCTSEADARTLVLSFNGNRAGYGWAVGAPSLALKNLLNFEYVEPGGLIVGDLVLLDAFQQVIKRRSHLPLPYTLKVEVCTGACLPNSEDQMVTFFQGFNDEGVVSLAETNRRLLWPVAGGEWQESVLLTYSLDGSLRGISPIEQLVRRLPCPSGSAVHDTTTGLRDCQECEPNEFNFHEDAKRCEACPAGVTCLGGSRIIASPGWWLDEHPANTFSLANSTHRLAFKCPPHACKGGRIVGEELNYTRRSAEILSDKPHENVCNEGRVGIVCGLCNATDGYHRVGTSCIQCGRYSKEQIGLTFFFIVVLILVLWYFVSARPIFLELEDIVIKMISPFVPASLRMKLRGGGGASLLLTNTLICYGKVCISLAQLVTAVPTVYRVDWPESLEYAMQFFNITQLNLFDIGIFRCILSDYFRQENTGFVYQYTLILVLPVILMFYFIAFSEIMGRIFPAKLVALRKYAQTAIFFMLYLIYPICSQTVLTVFNCQDLGRHGRRLVAEYNIDCDSSQHRVLQAVSFFLLFVYPFGVPFALAVLLYKYRIQHLVDAKIRRSRGRALLNHFFLYNKSPLPEEEEAAVLEELNSPTFELVFLSSALLVKMHTIYFPEDDTPATCEELLGKLIWRQKAMEHAGILRKVKLTWEDQDSRAAQLRELWRELLTDKKGSKDEMNVKRIQRLAEVAATFDAVRISESPSITEGDARNSFRRFFRNDAPKASPKALSSPTWTDFEQNHSFLRSAAVKQTETDLADEKTAMSTLKFMFKNYHPRYYWFDVVDLLRKFWFNSCMLLILPGEMLQIGIGVCTAIIFLFLQMHTSPWDMKYINTFHAVTLVVYIIILVLAMLISQKDPYTAYFFVNGAGGLVCSVIVIFTIIGVPIIMVASPSFFPNLRRWLLCTRKAEANFQQTWEEYQEETNRARHGLLSSNSGLYSSARNFRTASSDFASARLAKEHPKHSEHVSPAAPLQGGLTLSQMAQSSVGHERHEEAGRVLELETIPVEKKTASATPGGPCFGQAESQSLLLCGPAPAAIEHSTEPQAVYVHEDWV